MSKEKKTNQESIPIAVEQLSGEELGNLVGFFEILLRVDKRINPHKYLLDNNKIIHISSQKELAIGDYVKLIIRAKKINLKDTKAYVNDFMDIVGCYI